MYGNMKCVEFSKLSLNVLSLGLYKLLASTVLACVSRKVMRTNLEKYVMKALTTVRVKKLMWDVHCLLM